MKLISWNINGIRATRKKTFDATITAENPDILCVQETKAHEKVLSEANYTIAGYRRYWAEGVRPGYSGVAVWVKNELEVLSVEIGIGDPAYDNEGRTLILEFKDFFLINSYYPNGRDDLSRVPFKLDYSEKILRLALVKERLKPVILTGDFNTAHTALDLARPKENEANTGFLPIERQFLDKVAAAGYVDAFRKLHPTQGHTYSYWSYRGGAKDRNVGWRIDYFWVSAQLADRIKSLTHLSTENSSDHCPVILEI